MANHFRYFGAGALCWTGAKLFPDQMGANEEFALSYRTFQEDNILKRIGMIFKI